MGVFASRNRLGRILVATPLSLTPSRSDPSNRPPPLTRVAQQVLYSYAKSLNKQVVAVHSDNASASSVKRNAPRFARWLR